jgi:organic radical activating enzyme
MKLEYKNPEKENWFLVSWTLSNKCNYRCSYCPDFLHNGSAGWPEWQTVKDFISGFNLENKTICYRISGGEPTYWKHFQDMAKLVKDTGKFFTFLTNGSQTIKYFSDISKNTDAIILSYHDEYADLEHFCDIVKNVSCPVAVNLMISSENFDKLYHFSEKIFNFSPNVMIWPKVILDKTSNVEYITNKVHNYTDDQKKIIQSWPFIRKLEDKNVHRGDMMLDGVNISANDLILSGKNKHYDWKCWAGLHMINIDMFGDIYRADCKQGGSIGNLKNYTLPVSPIICKAKSCNCLNDIYVKKVFESPDIS